MTETIQTTPPATKELSPEQQQELDRVRLIQRTVAAGTTKDELLMFLYHAKKTGLDPLARQIYIIVRGKGDNRKATIQASIDGLRLVAERSGNYAGQDAPEFEVLDGEMKCTIRVYKFDAKGERYCHSVAVAYKSEYMPAAPMDFMWKTKPHIMLAKVTEALVLRKAFPQDLSGIYTEDEMAQAEAGSKRLIDPVTTEVVVKNEAPEPTPEVVEKTEEQQVLDGDTVTDEPETTPGTSDPVIDAWEKRILLVISENGLKIVEGEISANSALSPEQKEFIGSLVQSRRQQLANAAFGAK